jgi:hypothetical protein
VVIKRLWWRKWRVLFSAKTRGEGVRIPRLSRTFAIFHAFFARELRKKYFKA